MDTFFSDFLLQLAERDSFQEEAVLVFYKSAALLYPEQVKSIFDDNIKQRFNNVQTQAKAVLSSFNFIIYPDLKIIQIENDSGLKYHDRLIDVLQFVDKDDADLLSYYVEVGFWLDKQNFELLQLSSIYPTIINNT